MAKENIKNKNNLGMVIQPGGMRSLYGAAFCAGMISEEGYHMQKFKAIYGTSAAGIIAVYTAARQPEDLRNLFVDLVYSEGVVNPRRFWRPINAKKIKRAILNHAPINKDAFPLTPPAIIPLLNISKKRTDYINLNELGHDYYAGVLSATIALPLYDGSRVSIKGHKYVDAGISDNIPIKKALHDGCDGLVVILSRPLTHRRHRIPFLPRYARKMLAARTSLYAASLFGEEDSLYNEAMEILNNPDKAGVPIYIIHPPKEVLSFKLDEQKNKVLEKFWEIGFEDGITFAKELKDHSLQSAEENIL